MIEMKTKGFSSETNYQNQLLFFNLLLLILSGTFLIWGANTYINAYLEKPACSKVQ